MPRFDLGQDQQPPVPAPLASASAAHITWSDQGNDRSLVLLATAVAECGRRSDADICLRVEPTSQPDNRDKTFRISSDHFSIRYLGDRVELVDRGSTNGTFVIGSKRLEPNLPITIESGLQISIAESLELSFEVASRITASRSSDDVVSELRDPASDSNWLRTHLIGDDKPGKIAFVRIRRVNNLQGAEYPQRPCTIRPAPSSQEPWAALKPPAFAPHRKYRAAAGPARIARPRPADW